LFISIYVDIWIIRYIQQSKVTSVIESIPNSLICHYRCATTGIYELNHSGF